jgi:hypothetical protein
MQKRICWKKGMRLTDEVMRASDGSSAEYVGKALALAAIGRFGLFPSLQPFKISLNISNGIVDVESLSCLAIAKGGHLIDVHYDTSYTNVFDTRVQIPNNPEGKELLLLINLLPNQWKEVNDGFEEPLYSYSLIAPDNPIPEGSLPIARIVDEYGWRQDEQDFVPPCLFVSSHYKYEELLQRFSDLLATLDAKAKEAMKSGGRDTIRIFWPIVQQLRITANKECELMTPMVLLSNVQKCVSAFTCACDLDDSLELDNAKMFSSYVLAPFTYKDAYQRIKVGLELCFSITEKIDKIKNSTETKQEPIYTEPAKTPAPVIAKEALEQQCSTPETTMPVSCSDSSATIYFTTNGTVPTIKSETAKRTKNSFAIKFDNGFTQKGKEKERTITIKLMAVSNGINSSISSYEVALHKSTKFRDAIPI